MNIIRNEPWNYLSQFQNELLDLFDKRSADSSKIATSQWTPRVDIKEEQNQFVIHADLPGVKKEDIEVTMEENGTLTIKGERHTESSIQKEGYSRVERIAGSFYRRFSLPDTVDQDNIKAESTNGVLTITIPKKEKAKPRKISVREIK